MCGGGSVAQLGSFVAFINHNGHDGHKEELNSLPFVSLVSFVVTRRRYTELRSFQLRFRADLLRHAGELDEDFFELGVVLRG
jgi:hypothetical protein